ncbi:unnamed protein product [Rhodiola kirilowii]
MDLCGSGLKRSTNSDEAMSSLIAVKIYAARIQISVKELSIDI